MATVILTPQVWVRVLLVTGEKVLVNSRWRIALQFMLGVKCAENQDILYVISKHFEHEYYFHIIAHYLDHIS